MRENSTLLECPFSTLLAHRSCEFEALNSLQSSINPTWTAPMPHKKVLARSWPDASRAAVRISDYVMYPTLAGLVQKIAVGAFVELATSQRTSATAPAAQVLERPGSLAENHKPHVASALQTPLFDSWFFF